MITTPRVAATAEEVDADVSIFDNEILDQWELPFGEWIDQMVAWVDQNMEPVLNAIRWPFSFLLENLVDNFIAEISWVWVCLAVLVIGSLVRNVRIGASAAAALAGCGLLGTDYWFETARTIGMIVVAVILCALVGIPIGILCGRFDAAWNVVRPTLDAMQVVHAFVYMLPVIFFFSFGVVPGTMVTMIFAIPPLIRLTNLGIRQVPEDVVEASRAFGAPELRVLVDVQLPLARPAIMAGLNQTLLLSISMIGIAAIMGASGLGLLVFRAVQNLDVGLAASAGLALFLVAVVLDRISQPESGDGGNLMSRIARAWAHRSNPEALLDSGMASAEPATSNAPRVASVSAPERLGVLAAMAAAAVALVSTQLTWGRNAGLISGYARRADQDLAGAAFDGLDASGGTWFGMLVAAGALFVLLAGFTTLLRPERASRWLGPAGATLGAGLQVGAAVGYLVASPSTLTVDYAHGPGAYLAAAAAVVGLAAAVWWTAKAPFVSSRPIADGIAWPPLIGMAAALGFAVVALFSGWSFDRRADTVITPELQAEIDEVMGQLDSGELNAAIAAQEIQRINNSALARELIVIDGKSSDGTGLGLVVLALVVIGGLAAIPAAGLLGRLDDAGRWLWSALTAAFGVAAMGVAAAWVIGVMRVADSRFYSGAGAFLAFVAGFILLSSSRRFVALFRRRRVYGGDPVTSSGLDLDLDLEDTVEADGGNTDADREAAVTAAAP